MCGCNDAALMSQAAQAMRPIPLPTASTPTPHAVKNLLRPGAAKASSLLMTVPVPRSATHDSAELADPVEACANLDDPVGEIDRRGTVRNHQHKPADAELAYRSKNALLCRRVEMRSGLVQQEETRTALGAQEATGEGDALTFSRGEVGTVLRDPPARVETLAGSFRHSGCNVVVGGVGRAESNVGRDCVRHECGPLRHPRNVAKPALPLGLRYRNAVHPDRACARLDEAEHHAEQRGLAAAAAADQCDDFALAPTRKRLAQARRSHCRRAGH